MNKCKVVEMSLQKVTTQQWFNRGNGEYQYRVRFKLNDAIKHHYLNYRMNLSIWLKDQLVEQVGERGVDWKYYGGMYRQGRIAILCKSLDWLVMLHLDEDRAVFKNSIERVEEAV